MPLTPVMSLQDHVDFHVEPVQRLLHVLDVLGRHAHQIAAQPHVIAQPANVRRRNKPAAQKAMGMKHRQPLAVLHVALSPGKIAAMSSIDHQDFKTGFFQGRVEVDPIDPCGLHRHRAHALGLEIGAELFYLQGDGETLGSWPAREAKNFSLPTSTPAALGRTMGSSKGSFMV